MVEQRITEVEAEKQGKGLAVKTKHIRGKTRGKRLNSIMLLKTGWGKDLETTGGGGGQSERMEGSNQR